MNHFAHYVKREVIIKVNYLSPNDPWYAEHQPDDQGFEVPTYHVTRSTMGPATRVRAGDTIWLLSQLRTPRGWLRWGRFPPALDAKIIVSRVDGVDELAPHAGNEPSLRFSAGEGSSWFPLFDASDTLRKLTTFNPEEPEEEPRSLLATPTQTLGRALQSMRQIANAGPLVSLERRISQRGFDFVSYRLLDGTPSAFRKALQLVQVDRPVFWDRWSLPRRLAERREFLSDKALDEFIDNRIHASTTVWGIRSPRYAEPDSYSWKEMNLASELGKLRECREVGDGS